MVAGTIVSSVFDDGGTLGRLSLVVGLFCESIILNERFGLLSRSDISLTEIAELLPTPGEQILILCMFSDPRLSIHRNNSQSSQLLGGILECVKVSARGGKGCRRSGT